MLVYVDSDLFTSPAQTLVNTVNTVGVMGKGIAKTFKQIYPEMFRVYQEHCERGSQTPGALLLFKTNHKWILNFPTKRDWRNKSRLEDIELGLASFVESYQEHGIESAAFPQLGCGNGELDWERQVRPLMEHYLSGIGIDIYVHIYTGWQEPAEPREIEATCHWLRGEPVSLPFAEFWLDLISLVRDTPAEDGRRAIVEDTDETIKIGSPSDFVCVTRDDLFDLWQRFRSFGFLSEDDLPYRLGHRARDLMSLIERLPYVAPASVANAPERVDATAISTSALLRSPRSRGLRLVPVSIRHGSSGPLVVLHARETQMCLAELVS
jgi:O-acetyl-ADP-ribose deacetylase (regulator of RNase III)